MEVCGSTTLHRNILIDCSLLYFTSIILAHRPFWSVPTHYQVCNSAAQGIEKLVLLLESTFGLENITYLMGYCIYTGASVVLEDARNSNQGTEHPVLRTFLRALNSGMQRCPLIEKSLTIIIKSLHRASRDQLSTILTHGQDSFHAPLSADGWPTNPFIPAFPFPESTMTPDLNKIAYSGGNTINSVALLDSFPEMYLDLGDAFRPFS